MTELFDRSSALFTFKHTEYITPKPLYDKLNKKYNFTLDAATEPDNPLGTPKFYAEKDDGLDQSWKDETVYCNPPYHSRRITKWIEKAINSKAKLVVMLLPSRTDTSWFHSYLYRKKGVRIKFLKGRLRFRGKYGNQNTAPFPSLIAIIKP